ncbi:MAG TPA: hypothetical protein VFH97_01710 [Gemmatimonadales bacterium]|nr:hypothetical protein [Gemmatimonadales bacterium]
MRLLLRLIAAGIALPAAGACSGSDRTFDRGEPEIRYDAFQPQAGGPATSLQAPACADSVVGTAEIKEAAAIAPEGLRPRPRPQDAGWIPTRLADLAVGRAGYAVVDQGGVALTLFAPDFASRMHRERPGDGPGEFRSPAAVAVHPGADTTWVLDDRRRVVIAFDMTGAPVREIAVGPSGVDLAVGPDGVIYVAHRVPSARMLPRDADSVVVVSRYAPDGSRLPPLLILHRNALAPPRFVLPSVTEVGVTVSGERVAVFYPAGGVVDLFRNGRHEGAGLVCMTAELADVYARQRERPGQSQQWVALITDVRLEPDGGFSTVSSRTDRQGRFLIHRFAAGGGPAGAVAIANPGIRMPSEVRFGSRPDQLVAFSPASGIIASFTLRLR